VVLACDWMLVAVQLRRVEPWPGGRPTNQKSTRVTGTSTERGLHTSQGALAESGSSSITTVLCG
jgi:hypothetical protein